MNTDYQRFNNFVIELTTLSRKHGVGIMSLGGVFVIGDGHAAERIAYTGDAMRGNLKFNLSGEEPCLTQF